MERTREERFYEKVSKPGCLIWLGARNSWGYGTFMWFKDEAGVGHNINASRAAWLLQKGEIPEGLNVLHKCNNRQCVNVEHMYIGTDKDNSADMRRAGTLSSGERNYWAKLTDAKVLEVDRLRDEENLPFEEIAKRVGLGSASSVISVYFRKTWKHVPKLRPAVRVRKLREQWAA